VRTVSPRCPSVDQCLRSLFPFFSLCSAYRLSPVLFTVIGLGRLHLDRTLGPCSWVYQDGREVQGNATLHYAPDHMDKMVRTTKYSTVQLCWHIQGLRFRV